MGVHSLYSGISLVFSRWPWRCQFSHFPVWKLPPLSIHFTFYLFCIDIYTIKDNEFCDCHFVDSEWRMSYLSPFFSRALAAGLWGNFPGASGWVLPLRPGAILAVAWSVDMILIAFFGGLFPVTVRILTLVNYFMWCSLLHFGAIAYLCVNNFPAVTVLPAVRVRPVFRWAVFRHI